MLMTLIVSLSSADTRHFRDDTGTQSLAAGKGEDASLLYAAILTSIYGRFNPQKIQDIPWLLRKYKGTEEKLLQSIQSKYNIADARGSPESPFVQEDDDRSTAGASDAAQPARTVSVGDTIKAIYAKYNPAKLGDVPWLLRKYAGVEEKLLASIKKKYGLSDFDIEALRDNAAARQGGGKSAESEARQLVDDADAVVDKGRTDDRTLEEEGDHEEEFEGVAVPDAVNSEIESRLHEIYQSLYVAALTEIYQQHNPTKLIDIPRMLAKYKGSEQELIRSIKRKYGIEDTVSWGMGSQLKVSARCPLGGPTRDTIPPENRIDRPLTLPATFIRQRSPRLSGGDGQVRHWTTVTRLGHLKSCRRHRRS